MSADWVWDGGRPSVDLLNTVRDRVRGGRETLRDPVELAQWLSAAGLAEVITAATDTGPAVSASNPHPAGDATRSAAAGTGSAVTDADLAAARELRSAIDTALFAAAEGRSIPRDAITVINKAATRELGAAIDIALATAAKGKPMPRDAIVVITAAAVAPLVPQLTVDDDGHPIRRRPDRATTVAGALARIATDAIELVTGDELATLRVCAADDCGLRFVDRSPVGNRHWCSMRRCGNRAKARLHYARSRAARAGTND